MTQEEPTSESESHTTPQPNNPSTVVTLQLAHTLNETETAVQMSWSDGLKRQNGNPLGIGIEPFSGAVGFVAKNLEYPSFNRVLGVTAKHTDILEEIVGWYGRQGIPCQVEIVPHLADKALLHKLADLGLAQTDFNTVFYARPPFEPRPLLTEIELKQYEDDDLKLFAQLYVKLFPRLSPSEEEALRQETVARHSLPGWRCYLAWVDGKLAGYARMYVRDETASFSGAFSLHKFRGRGIQQTLLRRRVLDASALRCNLIVSQAAPGTTSQRNMEREGFRVAYHKAIFVVAHNTFNH
ncbi:MAG: GNAT family N-acetyltransferase [Chloroflexota bacterium]